MNSAGLAKGNWVGCMMASEPTSNGRRRRDHRTSGHLLPGVPETPLRREDPAQPRPARDSLPSGDLLDGASVHKMMYQQAPALGQDSIWRLSNQLAVSASLKCFGYTIRLRQLQTLRPVDRFKPCPLFAAPVPPGLVVRDRRQPVDSDDRPRNCARFSQPI